MSIEPDFRVFVPQIDVSLGGLDHPRSDQHALDETVGIALEIIAVFEGAGLTLVGIDGHQSRRRLSPHQGPLAAGRKPSAAETAQAGIADRLDDVVATALARETRPQESVAALCLVGREIFPATVSVACPPPATAAATLSGEDCGTCTWPTATTGARSQAPMHGARRTRTSGPSLPGNAARSFSAPAMAQDRLSQTLTVTAGGGGPSFTTSKCA